MLVDAVLEESGLAMKPNVVSCRRLPWSSLSIRRRGASWGPWEAIGSDFGRDVWIWEREDNALPRRATPWHARDTDDDVPSEDTRPVAPYVR